MSEQTPETQNLQLQIHKLYVKEASFEIPEGANTFRKDWAPQLNVDLQTQSKPLAEKNTHNVVLTVKCTVSNQGSTAFIVEIQQAGIFEIGLEQGDALHRVLGTFCPNLLYPYAREAISALVMKGGFPQLSLAPINFDMLYEQQQQSKPGVPDNVIPLHPKGNETRH